LAPAKKRLKAALKHGSASSPGAATRAKLMHVEHSLAQSIGRDFAFFKPDRILVPWDESAEPLTPETWKHLDIGIDQASV
jgi:hypothetical protein